MLFPSSQRDDFSPYLDADFLAEFWEDYARRTMTVIVGTLVVHLALFLFLQPSFVMPDLIEDEPEAIPVQIIAFGDVPKAVEPAPEENVVEPAPQRVEPKPRPAPTPRRVDPLPVRTLEPQLQTEPQIIPPPVPPLREPEIIPEPIETPPPEIVPPPVFTPDVLTTQTPEPDVETLPTPETVTPTPTPTPSVPEPIVAEPIVPEPIISEPARVPPVVSEPFVEALPDLQPFETLPPLPQTQIIQPQAFETPPLETPPVETPPVETQPAPLPPVETITPNPLPPSPDLDTPIVTTAPKILASPDAPITQQETLRAVPQSQADTLDIDPPKTLPQRGSAQPLTSLGQPPAGGGLPTFGSGSAPSGTVTPRGSTSPGASGWTLKQPGGTDVGSGLKGIVLDIRCREAGRTHADCPEYLRKFAGRNGSGFESFGAHAPSGSGISTSQGARASTTGGRSPQSGATPWNSSLGDNSINAGGPSTTIFDDSNFGRGFQGTNGEETGGSSGNRLRDVFKEPEVPWQEPEILLPQPPEDEE